MQTGGQFDRKKTKACNHSSRQNDRDRQNHCSTILDRQREPFPYKIQVSRHSDIYLTIYAPHQRWTVKQRLTDREPDIVIYPSISIHTDINRPNHRLAKTNVNNLSIPSCNPRKNNLISKVFQFVFQFSFSFARTVLSCKRRSQNRYKFFFLCWLALSLYRHEWLIS